MKTKNKPFSNDWITSLLNTSSDHPNYNIEEIYQNTEKSPGDLRRLAVTKTQLTKH